MAHFTYFFICWWAFWHYFLATVNNATRTTDHRSTNIGLIPAVMYTEVELLEWMANLSLNVLEAAVCVHPHLWTRGTAITSSFCFLFFPFPPSNSPPSQCEESIHLSSHKCSLQQCWHMPILTAVWGGGRRTIRSSMPSWGTQSFQSQPGLYETLSQKMENLLLPTKYPMNPECLALLLMGSWHQDGNMGFGEPQKWCFYLAV